MVHRSQFHKRSARGSPVFVLGAIVLAIAFVVWVLLPKKQNPYPRQTMVLVGSPMTLLSWNERDRNLLLITIPESVTAEGTHGYGTYSFEAFWRLGEIDKKDGTVLSESMSEALGVPVGAFIGPKTGIFGASEDPLAFAKGVFSVPHILSYISGIYRTNISFSSFINFVWILQVTKPDRVTTFDFTHTPDLIADDVTIADGSHELLVNPVRVDNRLAHIFEDERVRRETVTTAVFNTTAMPSLGTRAARLLGNVGVSVVSVGNDSPEIAGCTVSGTKELLMSDSAKVIGSVLGCTNREIAQSERADLTVRIGKSYAKRFLPN